MDLQLSGTGKDKTIYLKEIALRAILIDPNLYMDQGKTVTTSVQVYNRGQLAGPDIKVTMANISIPAIGHTQKTAANGVAHFELTGHIGLVTGYALLPGNNSQVSVTNFNPQTDTYMYVRVLPADTNIASKDPTWQNVLDYVLGNWQAMAPCMDNWLDLGNEEQVKAYGPIIKKLTDPTNFESYRCMPVTRDLPPGQRTLLYNFLDGASAPPVTEDKNSDGRAP